jgi:pyrroline-5-carboxylate reductase
MKITFLGGGNMANAIIGGLRKQDFAAADIQVVEPLASNRGQLTEAFGVHCVPAVDAGALECDVLVLAVKPQQAHDVLSHLGVAGNTHLIISIMAGVTLATISKHLGAYTRLVRTMPNTPALIGAGITGYYPYPGGVSDSDIVATETILKAVGSTVRVGYQEQLDVVTAVSGSGPAYVFHFIEALRDAGLELGLPAETANKLAIETMLGAAKLAAQSPDDVAVLRQRVTSKGGTTEAALASMTRDHVKESIIRAVKAASDRSRELGDELGKG